jgi:hypothetical protein
MSKIKLELHEIIDRLAQPKPDLEFEETLAGFHKSCDKIEQAIDRVIEEQELPNNWTVEADLEHQATTWGDC